ncbi:MAG: TAXI family TRAP transporter solute-binding subunit [Desulfovibrio sp.]|jgi:TRAP transporter TAXI family solute receptor|nr:TAXI family TRAP transporter solute-binding subunit [Desulfovibrio sp.]
MKKARRVIVAVAAVLLFAQAELAARKPDAATAVDSRREQSAPGKGWPNHLRFLTGPNGGQWFMMGDPIAGVLGRHVLPTTSRMGGGMTNIAGLNAKRGDIGFSLTCFLGAAQSGEKEYREIVTDNAVLLATVYPQVLYFLLRKDFADKHGIDSVETLLRKNIPVRFASLKPGTASEFIINLLLKYGYDTSFAELREQGWTLAFNNYAETADNFVAGDIDCFAYTAGTAVPLILTMEQHTGVVVLPVDQKVLDLLQQKFKTHTFTIDPGVYKSVPNPVKTLGDYTCLLIRKDLPDDLVFAVAKALWENKKAIADVVVDFNALSPDTALPQGLPAHPGAQAFWHNLAKNQP